MQKGLSACGVSSAWAPLGGLSEVRLQSDPEQQEFDSHYQMLDARSDSTMMSEASEEQRSWEGGFQVGC